MYQSHPTLCFHALALLYTTRHQKTHTGHQQWRDRFTGKADTQESRAPDDVYRSKCADEFNGRGPGGLHRF